MSSPQAARRAMLEASPPCRVLLLHHPECSQHATGDAHQEHPLRIDAVLARVLPPVASPEPRGTHGGSAAGGSAGEQAPRFIDPQNLRVMALCEVVKSESLKKHNTNIWTHLNHDEVVTRMLFVYVTWYQHANAYTPRVVDDDDHVACFFLLNKYMNEVRGDFPC